MTTAISGSDYAPSCYLDTARSNSTAHPPRPTAASKLKAVVAALGGWASGPESRTISNMLEFKAASTRSVSDGSHSLNTAKYGHKAALFLSPALFHESLTSVG